MTTPSRRETVPERWGEKREDEHRRKIARAVNDLQRGKGNNAYRVTLTPNAILTTLSVSYARSGGVALLQPETASAAASLANVCTRVGNEVVNIDHDSSPATDRTYGVVLFG